VDRVPFQVISNHGPHKDNYGVVEHEVIYTLFSITKLAELTALPLLPLQMIISSLDPISIYQPQKFLIFNRSLECHSSSNFVSLTSGNDQCLYRDDVSRE
jgi:hypothetical protein